MRDIKFRAWDKGYKGMYKVNSVHWDEFGVIDDITVTNGFDDTLVTGPGRVKCVELMQYTGVVDEKGVEICEGDIIQTKGTYPGEGWFDTGEHDYNFINSITWDCEELTYMVRGYQLKELENLTVIGNIYENPELLEVQE